MRTISSDYIKTIKAQIKIVNASLKRVQSAEKAEETAVNLQEYESAQQEAIDATLAAMAALGLAVRTASDMGVSTGAYETNVFHRVVENVLDK